MKREVLEIAEVIATGSITAREVHADYSRIVREEKINRVTPAMIDKVERIANLLDAPCAATSARPREDFDSTFQKALEGKKTDKMLTRRPGSG